MSCDITTITISPDKSFVINFLIPDMSNRSLASYLALDYNYYAIAEHQWEIVSKSTKLDQDEIIKVLKQNEYFRDLARDVESDGEYMGHPIVLREEFYNIVSYDMMQGIKKAKMGDCDNWV